LTGTRARDPELTGSMRDRDPETCRTAPKTATRSRHEPPRAAVARCRRFLAGAGIAYTAVMTPEDFKIACLCLEDCNLLIAAGKIQRWDVVKWAVTTNLALATASILLRSAHAGGMFFFFSLLVAAAGATLVYHYNRRMTGARDNATTIQNYLKDNKVDLSAIEEQPSADRATRSTSEYDLEELYIFNFIIGGSVLPSFLAWVLPLPS
jgi:hypothetical protein